MDDRVFVQDTGLASLDKLEHKGTESGSTGLIEQAGTAKSGGRWHSRDVRMRCCTPKCMSMLRMAYREANRHGRRDKETVLMGHNLAG